MALVSIPGGLWLPRLRYPYTSNTSTLNATAKKTAMMGRIYIEGRAASKTISSAGGKIAFQTNAITWANGSTTMDVGIQDLSTSSGPALQPDGSFDVKATLTGGAGLTGSAWNDIAMTTGTKTISHGDLIGVVLDMTNRAGADSVVIQHGEQGITAARTYPGQPATQDYTASWGTTLNASIPNIGITFDDGTLAIIDECVPYTSNADEAYSDSTNPDERGLIFQVPFDCKIDAFFMTLGNNGSGAAADYTVALYSAPTTSASVVSGSSITGYGEQLTSSFGDFDYVFTLPAEISLTRNTDYCLAVKATSSSSLRRAGFVLPSANYRKFLPSGTTLAKGTRDGGSGNFTSASTTIIYNMGVRVSQVYDSSGGGGGGGQRVISG